MEDACFPYIKASLMSVAAVSLGLHQLLYARKVLHGACRDCSASVLFPNF